MARDSANEGHERRHQVVRDGGILNVCITHYGNTRATLEKVAGGRYLLDRFKEAIDVPSVQELLKDSSSKSAQDMVNRVANMLCNRSKTAGSTLGNSVLNEHHGKKIVAMYRLG